MSYWRSLGYTGEMVIRRQGVPGPSPADRDAWRVKDTASLAGFGGSFANSETGVLHVWTTNPEHFDEQHAVEVLVRGGGAESLFSGVVRVDWDVTGVEVHRAEYTFADLKAWKDRLFERLPVDGLTAIAISERENRLKLWLEDPDRQAAEFRRRSVALGVPADAIIFAEGTYTPH